VTDVGTEFAGEFAELLRQYYIDHRTTSIQFESKFNLKANSKVLKNSI